MAFLAALFVGTSPSIGQTAALSVGVDVAIFSQRAEDWRKANIVHRQQALVRAEALGAQTQEAEQAAATVVPVTVVPVTVVPTTVPPVTLSTVADPSSGGPTAEQWAALRACESSGRYDVVNPNGRYRGAYQFSQATWDWIASGVNPSLIGRDPAAAAPADQDVLAAAMYDKSGPSSWPHCGVHLS